MPAFTKILEGFSAFRREVERGHVDLFARMAMKQDPRCMIIACCDARVDPAILTGAAPGELFVVRNVANLVPPRETDAHYHGTSAALEFAVLSLEVEYIVVMGHAQCGGVRALLAGAPGLGDDREFINRWMSLAEPARRRTVDCCHDQPFEQQAAFCEREVIKISLRNLMSFPWIAERVAEGSLKLRGLYFDIAAGTLLLYNPETDQFEPTEPRQES